MQFRPESARSLLQRRVTWSDFVTKEHAVSFKVDESRAVSWQKCTQPREDPSLRSGGQCGCLDWRDSDGCSSETSCQKCTQMGSLGPCPKGVVFRHRGRFSMGSCPKRVVFRHECRLNFALAPQKYPVRRRIPAEVRKDSVQFCRTSIRNRSYRAKIN